MVFVSFFSWWYGAGWLQVARSFKSRLQAVAELFSVHQLLRTLFAPWRRIISYPGASLQDKMRAWGDNLFSRTIGFVVRIIFLLAAGVTMLFVLAFTAVEVVLWPLLPPAVPGLFIAGLLV